MKQDKQGQLVCSWEEYWDYCNIVANSIIEDGKSYSQIIGILRGGFYLADYLSRKLNLPLSAIVAKSYSATNQQESLSVGDLSYLIKPAGKILLVDDLVDTGVTLRVIKQKLIQDFQVEVDTAVIWRKSKAEFMPNYYYSITPSDCWILQPCDAVIRA